jgi:hypothetical protein
MEEKPELVGGRLGAGRAVGGQMSLEGLYVVLGLTAPAVDVFVERTGVAPGQVGDDEAGVRSLRADLDAGDDALDAAPALSAVEEFLDTAQFACPRRGLKARLRRGFERLDMAASTGSRLDANPLQDAVQNRRQLWLNWIRHRALRAQILRASIAYAFGAVAISRTLRAWRSPAMRSRTRLSNPTPLGRRVLQSPEAFRRFVPR